MLNILIAGELHPAGLKIINQNSKYSVDYLKEVSNKNFLPYLKNADAMIVRTQTLNKNHISLLSVANLCRDLYSLYFELSQN